MRLRTAAGLTAEEPILAAVGLQGNLTSLLALRQSDGTRRQQGRAAVGGVQRDNQPALPVLRPDLPSLPTACEAAGNGVEGLHKRAAIESHRYRLIEYRSAFDVLLKQRRLRGLENDVKCVVRRLMVKRMGDTGWLRTLPPGSHALGGPEDRDTVMLHPPITRLSASWSKACAP